MNLHQAAPGRTRAELLPGDIVPDWALSDLDGNRFSVYNDSVEGRPLVLISCPRYSDANVDILDQYSATMSTFREQGAAIYAVFPNEKSARRHSALRFPGLIDRQQQLTDLFGSELTTVVLRNNNHVKGVVVGGNAAHLEKALAWVTSVRAEMQTIHMEQRHPPVLLVPEVFSADDCRKLIEIFRTRGQTFLEKTAASDYLGTDYKMRIPEHMREDRIDHFFFDKDTVEFLRQRLNRVIPEIHRAFQYRITKYESLRMASYEGTRAGLGYGHRDNIPPFTHRRFAMSINLNTDEFEGGALRFPEFGDQRYRPESGTAIVFSSSLLHEAMQVSAGRRFVFLAFLFGET
jgi:peroxiredoxin